MNAIDIGLGFGLLGGMLALLFIGIPIAYALLTAGLIGLALTKPWIAVEFLVSTFSYSASANLAYVVLPLFLFMGHMSFSAGIAHRAFDSARIWVGALPGGLAIATVFACAGFAAVSGSSSPLRRRSRMWRCHACCAKGIATLSPPAASRRRARLAF